ncbi:replication protein DnaD [Veillonella montpellierensis DNF00314]|uniref:Replication protein DnaD n=1 Tax=Veillonella montpellierensis DNF00314 TaxID=1401067 RepID=A0A096AL11_9FIRM|nr:Lin1244/Lin1753 domain-containing protein [Veillonella montpellierensis]KGF47768.1 replication protein DnaD [Veillonella montpellierensis DNF00314]
MAKDQSYYFSHDVNASSDPKVVAMISEYGMIAYAWWWIIIEKLASYEDYKLPLKKYTFIALDNALGVKNEENLTYVKHVFKQNEHVFKQNEHVLEQNELCSMCSFLFVKSLISDYELLACDDEYFWSPSLIRRFEFKKVKEETIREKRRLAGLKSAESRKAKKQNLTHVQQNLTHVQQNQLIKEKKRKEKNIYSYSYEEDAREKEIPNDPYKNVFKIYMNDVGEISPITKEKLEYLVDDFGEHEVITAISKASKEGKASSAYITAILNNKIREEAANGATKHNSRNRQNQKDEQVDWQAEYERAHGKE